MAELRRRVAPDQLPAGVTDAGLARLVKGLCSQLGCPAQDVVRYCSDVPLLLRLPSGRVQERLAYLQGQLGLCLQQARRVVRRCPQLVTLAAETLAAKAQGVAELLQLPLPAAGQVLSRAPQLLEFQTSTLQQHHAGLLRFMSPQQLARALAEEPALLARAPAALEAKLRLLQQLLLPADPHRVCDLVASQPSILLKSLPAVASSLRSISIWKMAPAEKLALVTSHPVLLAMSGDEVHGRCRWLRRLLLSNGYYHRVLRKLPPRLLGLLIHTLPRAWPRLLYLAESSQEAQMPLMRLLACSGEAFGRRFPQYATWHAWKVKQMVRGLGLGVGGEQGGRRKGGGGREAEGGGQAIRCVGPGSGGCTCTGRCAAPRTTHRLCLCLCLGTRGEECEGGQCMGCGGAGGVALSSAATLLQ